MSDSPWQPTFEGMEVTSIEATLSAANIVLDADMKMYDHCQLLVECMVTGVDYDAQKDKGGFLDTGRRKVRLTPMAVKVLRDGE